MCGLLVSKHVRNGTVESHRVFDIIFENIQIEQSIRIRIAMKDTRVIPNERRRREVQHTVLIAARRHQRVREYRTHSRNSEN